tara:strand:+ start:650 stop:949 length:300 start_codon:yes stop_codon:yes gene_type:complete
MSEKELSFSEHCQNCGRFREGEICDTCKLLSEIKSLQATIDDMKVIILDYSDENNYDDCLDDYGTLSFKDDLSNIYDFGSKARRFITKHPEIFNDKSEG